MISRRIFSGFVLVVIAAASLGFVAQGCANQSEGQVCNIENGNADCEDGLVCISKSELRGYADICCPAGGSEAPACTPDALAGGVGATGTGGTGGAGGAGGAGGTGGAGGQDGGM